jgi:hypothetical protein
MRTTKLEQMGELAAWQVAGIVNHIPFANANLKPSEINPYRVRRRGSKKLEEARAFVHALAFKAMMAGNMRKE